MSEQIINPKQPSPHDLSVLSYMDEGNSIHHTMALNKFRTTALRDIIYRLRKAGYVIFDRWVYYDNSEGKAKKYKLYWTKGETIMPSGAKTEKALKGDSIADISRNMAKISNNVPVQGNIFQNA